MNRLENHMVLGDYYEEDEVEEDFDYYDPIEELDWYQEDEE